MKFTLFMLSLPLLFVTACLSNNDSKTSESSSSSSIHSINTSSSSLASQSSQLLSSAKILPTFGTVIDSENGNIYKTVVIGKQTWMAENIDVGNFVFDDYYETYQDFALDLDEKFCPYNFKEDCKIFGAFYQWHSAVKLSNRCSFIPCPEQISSPHKGICPDQYHIPSHADWDTLITYLGSTSTKMRGPMPLNSNHNPDITNKWFDSTDVNANSSGFGAIKLRYRINYGGLTQDSTTAYFLTSLEISGEKAEYVKVSYNQKTSFVTMSKLTGASVRCVKD